MLYASCRQNYPDLLTNDIQHVEGIWYYSCEYLILTGSLMIIHEHYAVRN